MKKYIVTISREYGAGGHSIGKRVAEELGIPIYDKDIVKQTAEASGYSPELVESEGEDISRTDSIIRGIVASSVFYSDSQDVIHDVQQAIILKFAQAGPCVIVGRCADEVLRKAGIDGLHVFIYADEERRAVRVGEMLGSSNATEIRRLMSRKDASRHAYYNRYAGKKWGDGRNYHMTLDSGVLGYDLCVKLIVDAAKALDAAPAQVKKGG
ncbi:MAG: cytidylate kinase-like family protein [Oscillibacter sp.]|nr:cytidylate kinase-like family protein [Oscillibacter sp.]